ncbi:unnamed protein product, partial [Sphagnum tenellum]
MHYTPHVDLAFLSVEHIMRDVKGGWLLRYMHANGATFAIFFSIFVFYAPNVLGHPDNYIPANPMSTPAHIVPE